MASLEIILPSGHSELVKVEMDQKVGDVTKLVQKKMLSLKDWLKSSIFFKFVVFVDFFEVEVESHEVFTLHILLGGGLIQIFFHFDPWDKWSNLTSIFFSMGWNHHLVIIFFCLLSICCVKLFEHHGLSVGTTIDLTWLKFWEFFTFSVF